MNQGQFEQVFGELTPGRRKVLLRFLAGETDKEIADSLYMAETTVRKHIEAICKEFKCEPNESRSKRPHLIGLFCKYKPELVKECTPPVTSKVETIETLGAENNSYLSISQASPSKTDPNFVGREEAIAHLNTLVNQGAKVILIHAKGGVGKTTLARKYLQQEFSAYIEFPIAKETQNITSVESLIEERLRQLGEEPGREFGVSLDRLKRKLQTERIGVLIDNLEPALDQNGKLIEPHRRYVELLITLADPAVQSVTLITSRECLRESSVAVRQYLLEGLELAAWQEFFNSHNLQTDTLALSAMQEAYGGNAKAMEILSSAIQRDYGGNLEAYWQANQKYLPIERELEDLVACQFNRLEKIDLSAFKLLCRLGCYRYQDVATIPRDGLFCLLWDVPETNHLQVVNSLRDRSLVEFCNGEYWLHPVIRAEAIARLRTSEDWETANRKAAIFWTGSVSTVETIENALIAFEAFPHYLEINNFELACSVIIKQRDNQWEEGEALGYSFFRLGLLQQMISAINRIINDINPGIFVSILYNLLGDLYWKSGNIHESIKCHSESGNIASKELELAQGLESIKLRLMRLNAVSFLNMGLCKIDLGEIEEAIELFTKFKILAETQSYKDNQGRIYYIKGASYFCLAFCYSCLDSRKEAYSFVKQAESEIQSNKSNRKNAWSTGYRLLFLGLTYKKLQETEKSFGMFHQAIAYAQESYYTEVEAKALYGLAELCREQGDFKKALANHLKSIEILDKIGAKCDLAEAYYQLGLTYQKAGNAEKSQENFDRAIRLFTEMEAPKQVNKVRRAMEIGG